MLCLKKELCEYPDVQIALTTSVYLQSSF